MAPYLPQTDHSASHSSLVSSFITQLEMMVGQFAVGDFSSSRERRRGRSPSRRKPLPYTSRVLHRCDGNSSIRSSIDNGAGSLCLDYRDLHNQIATVEIDPEGDVLLIMGESCVENKTKTEPEPEPEQITLMTFKVCSRTISRASTPLKEIILMEGKKVDINNERWIVHLPDDLPKPFATLLKIMHGYFDQVPVGNPHTYGEIYEIAVLADKYDVARLLRPWASQWIKSLGTQLEDTDVNAIECLERRSWIAWVLGGKETFCRSLYGLAIRACNDASPKEKNKSIQLQNLFHEIKEPPGALDAITALRLEILEAMLKPFRDSERAIIAQENTTPSGCFGCATHSARCNDVMLVSAIRCLAISGLWPLPEPSQIEVSACSIEKRLRSLNILAHPRHAKCQQSLESFLKNRWPSQGHSLRITEPQRRHLEAQAKKTGLEHVAFDV
ncbi:uncharacterized protein BCR38DRAFT_491125 [Pseudomassariella vexata]|uniref:BTB domain-containing protein n=1 Tax=Pseudomassariella vexata TaxID=1141098 RepID=A0A1Y2D8B4_9PEZI|nr:uncharacterized protein BCR38DRAFT_491125 [Pseudomassariella vexata]ORY55499.1 hypothetical protein BCR38DRAFT_491125 [Pseudomassariella vexata]